MLSVFNTPIVVLSHTHMHVYTNLRAHTHIVRSCVLFPTHQWLCLSEIMPLPNNNPAVFQSGHTCHGVMELRHVTHMHSFAALESRLTQYAATQCNTLQQHSATLCNTMQYSATFCSTATRCRSTLQHAAC